MAQRVCPLLVIAILFAPLGASGATPTEPELRGELLRMKDAGQAVRDLSLTAEGEERVHSAVDAVHTARLESTVAARGWPTGAQVGQDGADAACLLAQHSDKAPALQRSLAEAMEPLVATGQVKASSYAYLWDHTNDPQRYGTQGRCADMGHWEYCLAALRAW